MMCRQVLPDPVDGIEQIYIVKTEPGLEDESNMVPETVDQIKTEPNFEDEEAYDHPDDNLTEEVEFESVDAIIKEEPKVDSGSETEEMVTTKLKIKSEPPSKDRIDDKKECKEKSKPKTGKKEAKRPASKPKQEKKQKISSKNDDNGIVQEKRFSCHLCDKKTNNEYNLQTHLKTHDKVKDLTCQICGKSSQSKFYLRKHLESHERKALKQAKKPKKEVLEKHQRYVCRYCSSKFTKFSNLRRHEDLHDIPPEQQVHKRKEFFCYVCDQECGSKKGIQEHLYTHADLLPYTCVECDKPLSIKSVRTLNEHLEMHKDTSTGSIKCTWCSMRFHVLKTCKSHERTHVMEGGSALEALERRASFLSKKKNIKIIVVEGILRYACDLCEKSYTHETALQDHMNTHTDSDRPKKLHVCPICNEVFAFAGGLYTHKLVHSDQLPYKCEYCDRAFKAAIRLINHRRTHTGERPFVCKCGKAFAKSYTMTSHKRICLAPELLQTCSCRICGDEAFPTYSDLIRHVTEEHTEPIPRTKCQFCPVLSRNALLLVRHEHRHQMPNVIKCDQCNRIFKTQALLEEHEVTHINTPKSFICDICGMTFDRLKRLKKHKENHTKVPRKPTLKYSCELCPKKFSWLGNFRCHQKLHYNKKSRHYIPSLVEGPPPEPEPDRSENEVNMDFGMLVKTETE